MQRLRGYDLRLSRLPSVLGLCQGDQPQLFQYINSAQERLLMCKEAGDEGWYGTFAEILLSNVSRATPYITLPREVARLEAVNLCDRVIPVNNQFLEYMDFGNGRMPKHFARMDDWCIPQVYSRNNAVTFADPPVTPFALWAYATNPADMAGISRILFQGLDSNGNTIYTADGNNNVMGEFVTLASPFAASTFIYSKITGIQKDVTQGEVQVFAVDSNGNQTLLLTMEPGETVANYRRYYVHNLPWSCCNPPLTSPCVPTVPANVQMRAIVKLELIPVATDTDYCLIQSQEAIIEECAAIRYEGMDNPPAKGFSAGHHQQAVRYLNGQIVHYYGKDEPAVIFAPFGSARLERLNIAMQ